MFADLNLARRLERTEGFAAAAFVEARGGQSKWVHISGCYAMFDGAESPLTQTFGLGMFEAATGSVLRQIEEFFEIQKAPVMHEVCPLAGIPLLRMLAESGYVPYEVSNVMFLSLIDRHLRPELSAELTVRMALDRDADIYCEAASKGWSETGEIAQAVSEMSQVMFRAKGYKGFLVEMGDRTIATAGLVTDEAVALLAGASTVPEHRGLGAQRAVLSARLEYARNLGCDVAMMVTEPGSASQRNAERYGFRIAYTRTKWRKNRDIVKG